MILVRAENLDRISRINSHFLSQISRSKLTKKHPTTPLFLHLRNFFECNVWLFLVFILIQFHRFALVLNVSGVCFFWFTAGYFWGSQSPHGGHYLWGGCFRWWSLAITFQPNVLKWLKTALFVTWFLCFYDPLDVITRPEIIFPTTTKSNEEFTI